MAVSERPNPNNPFLPSRGELLLELADIDRLLEFVDANENLFERTHQREQLMELRDEIQANLELTFPKLKEEELPHNPQ